MQKASRMMENVQSISEGVEYLTPRNIIVMKGAAIREAPVA